MFVMGQITGKNRPISAASSWIRLAALGLLLSVLLQGASCQVEPTESQCRPYIEKALKQQHPDVEEKFQEDETKEDVLTGEEENVPTDELTQTIEDSIQAGEGEDLKSEEFDAEDAKGSADVSEEGENEETERDAGKDEDFDADERRREEERENDDGGEGSDKEEAAPSETIEEEEPVEVTEREERQDEETSREGEEEIPEEGETEDVLEVVKEGVEVIREEIREDRVREEAPLAGEDEEEREEERSTGEDHLVREEEMKTGEDEAREGEEMQEEAARQEEKIDEEEAREHEKGDETLETREKGEGEEIETQQDEPQRGEEREGEMEGEEAVTEESTEAKQEAETSFEADETEAQVAQERLDEQEEGRGESQVESPGEGAEDATQQMGEEVKSEAAALEESETPGEMAPPQETEEESEGASQPDVHESAAEAAEETQEQTPEEEDLTKEVIIPENLRPRDHITQILKLDEDSVQTEFAIVKAIDSTLKSLKNLYDNAIKPLEILYKYRDLSNRHFGDPEIFSKPLILFMGPWSGGKSSTINYLLNNEFSATSLRTGAEPSPAYFNILMYGEEEEILDGTQLAADWTFSGLQKFGQTLLDRLKGYKLPSRLLEKVNIVEIPGILEIRKQVQRLFPFNDACQWFIDRADIIFLVYDPSKLDVGPETEAILDQLKGREYQTRIILNKADQVKPEELMRVQGTLIWNISPLMSSTEPPIMYSTSLWSLPYENGAPTRLLLAQERAFLRDLREAIDKRVENKIASARRFAVRVRNHAKMVDCYLTTYYNHKTFFGNRKKISDDIIENPQKYHIYEGLSTLTNISRYDLPDPDVYKDFFRINPLYDFTKLSDTCTYFRGCPINKLDVAIAYDLPELVGKYKKSVEASKSQTQKINS